RRRRRCRCVRRPRCAGRHRPRDLLDQRGVVIEQATMTEMAFGNQGNAILPEAPDDRVALIDFGTGVERRFTYGDLRRRTGAVARGLLRRGLERGDRVAILTLNRAEFLFSFLGAMQAGLVAVPVNHKLPPDTVSYIVND